MLPVGESPGHGVSSQQQRLRQQAVLALVLVGPLQMLGLHAFATQLYICAFATNYQIVIHERIIFTFLV